MMKAIKEGKPMRKTKKGMKEERIYFNCKNYKIDKKERKENFVNLLKRKWIVTCKY